MEEFIAFQSTKLFLPRPGKGKKKRTLIWCWFLARMFASNFNNYANFSMISMFLHTYLSSDWDFWGIHNQFQEPILHITTPKSRIHMLQREKCLGVQPHNAIFFSIFINPNFQTIKIGHTPYIPFTLCFSLFFYIALIIASIIFSFQIISLR